MLLVALWLGALPGPSQGASCRAPAEPPRRTLRCGFGLVGSLTLSEAGGLGRVGLLAAHAGAGLIALDGTRVLGAAAEVAPRNERAGVLGSPYAMDVVVHRGLVLLTDAASGRLTLLRPAF